MLRRFTHFGQKRPNAWIIAWVLWFITLCFLSSGSTAPQDIPKIPHLDKIAHFGFFFGGAGLLSAWLRHRFQKFNAPQCIGITTILGSIVGVIDEYHQTFTPGRSGNDIGDWTADTLGSFTGAIVMILVLKYTATWDSRKNQSQINSESS
ncbi:MAG: VanZ family protein [Crocinitomicaceae bacterium]|jgi:VanZ family protein